MDPKSFHQRVLTHLEMLPNGISIGIAVSGGADSVALFRAILVLAPERAWKLIVLHVNHKLRSEESEQDASFVKQLADEMGLFHTMAELPLSGSGNLEQEARNLRNSWFREMMRVHSLHKIALGHTKSDQAETVLFRLLRGTGSAGLSGIRPLTRDGFVRPLLQITRQETREYLRSIAQPWREDSSNQSLTFDRNRIRLELLPALAEQWNPQIETILAALADWAHAEEDYWEQVITDLAGRHLKASLGNDAQLCTTEALTALPTAAARRLIRHAIQLVKGDLQSVDFGHVEKIFALAAQKEGSGRLQIPGVDIMRSFDWLRFAQPGTYSKDRHWSCAAPIPSQIPLPGGLTSLLLQLNNGNCPYTRVVDCLDRDCLPGSLELRTWQPGDKYQPGSHNAPVKLKTLFQDARIPLWDRNWWPVLAVTGTIGGSIVWTRQFGVAAEFAAGPATRNRVVVEEIPSDAPKTSFPEKHLGSGVARL